MYNPAENAVLIASVSAAKESHANYWEAVCDTAYNLLQSACVILV